MDSLAKLVSGRLKAQPAPGPHPDPELLAAFAENALPDGDRGVLLRHLGACSDCREILYLALPDSPEAQKVLVVQPRRFRRWAVAWRTLVASVAIAAIFFSANRLGHKNQSALMVASAPRRATETEPKIAAEKTPPELDQIQAVRDASKAKLAPALTASETKPQPEAKHMTAKLQPDLVFEQSGQVRVQAPAKSADAEAVLAGKDERQKQNPGIAVLNRDATQTGSSGKLGAYAYRRGEPSQTKADQQVVAGQQAAVQADAVSEPDSEQAYARRTPTKATAAVQGSARNDLPAAQETTTLTGSSQPTDGPAQDKNAIASASSSLGLAKESTVKGNLGGIILDPSGAVVANAKVTAVGPIGTQTVTSDPEGKFAFGRLPSGFYAIKAEASGFKTAEVKQVAVLDDSASALRLTLDVGTVSETVEVSAAALESSTGLVVGQKEVEAKLSRKKATAANTRQQGIGAGAGLPIFQWTLSPEGDVQRSGDSGKTWLTVVIAPGATFRALSAVGANVWVGGKAGALYHSVDSGQTWAKVEPATAGKKLAHDIVHVDFSDTLSGTVNTADGEVWTTSDGGQNWLRK